MEIQTIFLILGIITVLSGIFVYIHGIIKKNIKPHPFTWLGWSILVGVISYAQLTENGGIGSYILMVESFFLFFIFLLSLKYGEKNIYKTDILSIGFGLLAIILWYFTQNPLLAVILITISDVIMYLPTIKKTFSHPFEEELFEYYTATLAYIFSFFALSTISLVTFLYPAVLIVLNIIFILFTLSLRKNFINYKNIKITKSDRKALYDISLESANSNEKIIYIYEKYSLDLLLGEKISEEVRNEFLKNNVHAKSIVNSKRDYYSKTKLKEFKLLNTQLIISKNILNIEYEMIIFDNTVVIYDIDSENKVKIFRDKKMADHQKQLFISFWNTNSSEKVRNL